MSLSPEEYRRLTEPFVEEFKAAEKEAQRSRDEAFERAEQEYRAALQTIANEYGYAIKEAARICQEKSREATRGDN